MGIGSSVKHSYNVYFQFLLYAISINPFSNNFNNNMDVRVEPFRTRFQISKKRKKRRSYLSLFIVTQILELWASLVTTKKNLELSKCSKSNTATQILFLVASFFLLDHASSLRWGLENSHRRLLRALPLQL